MLSTLTAKITFEIINIRNWLVCLLLLLVASVQNIALAQDIPGSSQTSYAVTPSGAFQFQVPISLPSGRNGIQPNLALSFSSSRGNGRLGVGWDLTGLSGIYRCGKTMAIDGENRNYNYTINDRFCLDGQRLILNSGIYGAANSEYRTEIDSHTRIVAIGSSENADGTFAPASFRVYKKDGMVYEYGVGGHSNVKLSGTNIVHCWKLSVVKDLNGNFYQITYRSIDGQPELIQYTKRGPDQGKFSVEFGYQSRTDRIRHYGAGRLRKMDHRMNAVTVKKGGSIVRKYEMVYRYSANKLSELTSIKECGIGGTDCYPPISVVWKNDAKGFQNAAAIHNPPEAMFKYDGDDYIQRGQWADINADGWVDQLIAYTEKSGSQVIKTFLGGPDGFSSSNNWKLPEILVDHSTNITAHSQVGSRSIQKGQLIDVNADGYPDVVYSWTHMAGAGSSRGFIHDKQVYLNNKNGGWIASSAYENTLPEILFSYADNGVIFQHSPGACTANPHPHSCQSTAYTLTQRGRFVDINNDGLVDWVTAYRAGYGTPKREVYLNKNNRWERQPGYNFPDHFEQYSNGRSMTRGNLVDLNGDGLLDYIQSYNFDHNTHGGVARKVWRNTGSKFVEDSSFHKSLPTIAHENSPGLSHPKSHGTYLDLNGDGLTDYIVDSQTGANTSGADIGKVAYLNTGKGWVRSSAYENKFTQKRNLNAGLVHPQGQYIDINRDGLVY